MFHSQTLHLRLLWLPLFVIAGVSCLSGTEGPQTGGIHFTGMDKVGHFVIFGLLAVAWARTFTERLRKPIVYLISVILTTGFGYADELHQLTNPHRLFEWADLLANFLGAVAGAGVYLYSSFWRSRLEASWRAVWPWNWIRWIQGRKI